MTLQVEPLEINWRWCNLSVPSSNPSSGKAVYTRQSWVGPEVPDKRHKLTCGSHSQGVSSQCCILHGIFKICTFIFFLISFQFSDSSLNVVASGESHLGNTKSLKYIEISVMGLVFYFYVFLLGTEFRIYPLLRVCWKQSPSVFNHFKIILSPILNKHSGHG